MVEEKVRVRIDPKVFESVMLDELGTKIDRLSDILEDLKDRSDTSLLERTRSAVHGRLARREEGISIIERAVGLATPVDDKLDTIIYLLSILAGVEIPDIEMPEFRPPFYLREIIEKQRDVFQEFTTTISERVIERVIEREVREAFATGYVTYPKDGGDKEISTGGDVVIDLTEGEVTLPDNTIEKLSAKIGRFGALKARSAFIYVSRDSTIQLDGEGKFKIEGGTEYPITFQEFTRITLNVPDNTKIRVNASIHPRGIPQRIRGLTQEYYFNKEKKKLSVTTAETSHTFTIPAKLVLVYAEDTKILVDADESIDDDTMPIVAGGSKTFPKYTQTIYAKAVSGSGTLYIEGYY